MLLFLSKKPLFNTNLSDAQHVSECLPMMAETVFRKLLQQYTGKFAASGVRLLIKPHR
jgi:hypothetical protein